MTKVTLSGHIIVPENDLKRVLAELPNHIALTHQEAGCLVFTVEQNMTNRFRFDVYEEFIDKASFETHQARVAVSYWGEVTKHVERFYYLNSNVKEG